jgi:hypothetical protein
MISARARKLETEGWVHSTTAPLITLSFHRTHHQSAQLRGTQHRSTRCARNRLPGDTLHRSTSAAEEWHREMSAGRRFWDAIDDQGDRSMHSKTSYHSLIPFCTTLECTAHVHVTVGSNQLTHQHTSCTTNSGTIPNRPEFSPSSLKISHKCIKMHRFALV